ncbi:hypothetical protein WDU94_003452, partial [Cyamophila willieti]
MCYNVIQDILHLPLNDLVDINVARRGDITEIAMKSLELYGDRPFQPLQEYYSDLQLQGGPDQPLTTLYFSFLHAPSISLTLISSPQSSQLSLSFSHVSYVSIILDDLTRKYSGRITLDGKPIGLTLCGSGGNLSTVTSVMYRAVDEFDERVAVLNKVKADLVTLSTMYRAIERRLLSKIKDKTNSNLSSIERLLQDTFERIINSIQAYTHAQNAMTSCVQELKQVLRLLGMIVRDKYDQDGIGLIEACLRTVCQMYNQDQRWTEVCCKQLDYI